MKEGPSQQPAASGQQPAVSSQGRKAPAGNWKTPNGPDCRPGLRKNVVHQASSSIIKYTLKSLTDEVIFSLVLYNEYTSEGKQTMQLKSIKAHEEKMELCKHVSCIRKRNLAY